MALNFSYAVPFSSKFLATHNSVPELNFPDILISSAAIMIDLSFKSLGESMSFLRTCNTSIASNAGPIPLPTGCVPSVIIISVWIFRASLTALK